MKKIFNFIYNNSTAICTILFYILAGLDVIFSQGQDHYLLFLIALAFNILYYVEQREE